MEPGSGSDSGNAAGPADGAEAVSGSLDIDSPARDPKRNGTPSSGIVPFVSEGFEGWIEASEDDRSLPEAAEALLIGYRDRGDCVLARSGYIDFSGSVWSCTVVGDGWVEIRLVQELEEGRSGVHLIHMVGRKEASG